jgi:hypothetical protein
MGTDVTYGQPSHILRSVDNQSSVYNTYFPGYFDGAIIQNSIKIMMWGTQYSRQLSANSQNWPKLFKVNYGSLIGANIAPSTGRTNAILYPDSSNSAVNFRDDNTGRVPVINF